MWLDLCLGLAYLTLSSLLLVLNLALEPNTNTTKGSRGLSPALVARRWRRQREFLALSCDAAVLLAYLSFSRSTSLLTSMTTSTFLTNCHAAPLPLDLTDRIDKDHSESLRFAYSTLNGLMILMAFMVRRKSFLLGLIGLAW